MYPLVHAAASVQLEAVRWLLQQGMTADELRAALTVAAQEGHASATRLLLETGVDITADVPAILKIALEHQSVAVAQMLLEAGVFEGSPAAGGSTQLKSNRAVLSALKQSLQDITLGHSAALFQAAVKGGHTAFAELLQQAVSEMHQCETAAGTEQLGAGQ
jgi:hypothetical protein